MLSLPTCLYTSCMCCPFRSSIGKPCHLKFGGGANRGTVGVSEWLGAVVGEVGVMKLEKHVEIAVTVGQIQTPPDA